MNKVLTFLFLFFFVLASSAQNKNYLIEGKIQNIYQGKIFLVPNSINNEYYGGKNIIDSSDIKNGVFGFKRDVTKSEPLAYRLIIRNESIFLSTGLILLSSSDRKIEIDSVNEFISPNVPNSTNQKELRNEYCPYFKQIIDESRTLFSNQDSLYELYGKKMPEEITQKFSINEDKLSAKSDSFFFTYAITHLNSYVTLWKLIERFEDFGYKNQYYDIFNKLSPTIKKSSTAKTLYIKLKLAKLLSINAKFPKLKLKNLLGSNTSLNAKYLKSKYTLVDFWFVGCSPCIKQFPHLKKIFETYNRTDFNIVGVSIDKEADFDKLKTFISEKKIRWSNLLDQGGGISSNLGVNSFPTNFLLNQKGTIIRKNISPSELSLFLKNDIGNNK